MIFLLTLFVEFKDLGWVQGMSRGVLPVVGVMMALLTIDFLSKAKAKTTWVFLIPFTLVSLVLLVPLNVHPAIIIAVIIIFSLLRREGRKA